MYRKYLKMERTNTMIASDLNNEIKSPAKPLRKRAPGAGRKPRGEGPAQHFTTRLAPEVRQQLQLEAQRNNRTLSHEVELRLRASVAMPARQADRQSRALAYLVGQIVTIFRSADRQENTSEFNWRADPFDYAALRSAIVQILDHLAPPGEPGPTRYTLFRDVEDAARIVASIVLMQLTMDPKESRLIGIEAGRPSGSMWFGFPEAAEDLGLAPARTD
jgi:hypothetical protein